MKNCSLKVLASHESYLAIISDDRAVTRCPVDVHCGSGIMYEGYLESS